MDPHLVSSFPEIWLVQCLETWTWISMGSNFDASLLLRFLGKVRYHTSMRCGCRGAFDGIFNKPPPEAKTYRRHSWCSNRAKCVPFCRDEHSPGQEPSKQRNICHSMQIVMNKHQNLNFWILASLRGRVLCAAPLVKILMLRNDDPTMTALALRCGQNRHSHKVQICYIIPTPHNIRQFQQQSIFRVYVRALAMVSAASKHELQEENWTSPVTGAHRHTKHGYDW